MARKPAISGANKISLKKKPESFTIQAFYLFKVPG